MKLSDYFDKIFIIGSVNSPKVNHTIESLKKLGLYDENVIIYIYPIVTDLNIVLGIPNDVNGMGDDRISLSIAHYTIINQSYNSGLKNFLLLEDDNYFYDDISKWEEVLTTMPDDWDVMKFTGFIFPPCDMNNPLSMPINLIYNKLFRKIDINIDDVSSWAYSTSAIAFNRNAMKLYIDNQKKHFKFVDHIDGINEFTKNTKLDLNIYMPTIPLFVPIDDVEKKYKCGYYLKYDKKKYI